MPWPAHQSQHYRYHATCTQDARLTACPSVLPPPPRYPVGGYPGAPPGQLIETNNTISHPTGPEYQLVVGEGMSTRRMCAAHTGPFADR